MDKNIFTIEETRTDEEKEAARIAEVEKEKQKRINYGLTFFSR